MKKITEEAWKKCPKCGKTKNQIKAGYNASGSQRCKCKECGVYYTIEPKRHEYPEETRQLAITMYYGGISGRGVGKILKMNKSNVMNWIKKRAKNDLKDQTVSVCSGTVELDELYWFLEYKPRTETRENVYIMTMVSREPRQIVGYRVSPNKAAGTIQQMVDAAPAANQYCTDGYFGYLDVIFPGKHIFNIHSKKDTFTVEGVNADLRHYIPTLARRSRCFPRKLENLQAVLSVFVQAYNRFGRQKMLYRSRYHSSSVPFSLFDFF